MKNNKIIAYVAAESGGHILPALALAQQWKNENESGCILFFTGSSPLEKKITSQNALNIRFLYCSVIKRRLITLPILMTLLLWAFIKSFYVFVHNRPEAVVSTGGILSIPVCLAAFVLRIPVSLYELNVVPGKANKLLFPFATHIFTVFSQTGQHCHWKKNDFSSRCKLATYPLRFFEKDKIGSKEQIITYINDKLTAAKDALLFDTNRKTLFVLGGSQGSLLLNNLIEQCVDQNHDLAARVQIIHQTGPADAQRIRNFYARLAIPALTFSYDENVKFYYQCADLIFCRAGAGTLFEIAFFAKRCIVIPLISATTTHQKDNALAMAQMHSDLFSVIDQAEVMGKPELFFDLVKKFI